MAVTEGPDEPSRVIVRAVTVLVGLGMIAPAVTPGTALAVGAAIGLTAGDPFRTTSRAAALLLRAAVIGLGFGLSLPAVLATGAAGVAITAVGVTATMLVGLALTRAFAVEPTTGVLISGGTAICGGSAVAALSPALGASAASTSIAVATVFVLNGAALYIFPLVGEALHLSQQQFAVWAAVAIHDTASVVGAAATYGDVALEQATVLKLVRALWIAPLTLAVVWWRRRSDPNAAGRATMPWFIVLFAAAAALRTGVPVGAPAYDLLELAARRGLVVALFLIGLGLTRQRLRTIGLRPLLLGTTLWLAVASVSLALITSV